MSRKGGRTPKRSVQEYVDAIQKAKGMISVAARLLGVSRRTIYDKAEKYPRVREALEDSREEMTDFAEGKLYDRIRKGDTTAIIFYLKTQAKQRGYVEKQEIDAAHHFPGIVGIDVHLTEDAGIDDE